MSSTRQPAPSAGCVTAGSGIARGSECGSDGGSTMASPLDSVHPPVCACARADGDASPAGDSHSSATAGLPVDMGLSASCSSACRASLAGGNLACGGGTVGQLHPGATDRTPLVQARRRERRAPDRPGLDASVRVAPEPQPGPRAKIVQAHAVDHVACTAGEPAVLATREFDVPRLVSERRRPRIGISTRERPR